MWSHNVRLKITNRISMQDKANSIDSMTMRFIIPFTDYCDVKDPTATCSQMEYNHNHFIEQNGKISKEKRREKNTIKWKKTVSVEMYASTKRGCPYTIVHGSSFQCNKYKCLKLNRARTTQHVRHKSECWTKRKRKLQHSFTIAARRNERGGEMIMHFVRETCGSYDDRKNFP